MTFCENDVMLSSGWWLSFSTYTVVSVLLSSLKDSSDPLVIFGAVLVILWEPPRQKMV